MNILSQLKKKQCTAYGFILVLSLFSACKKEVTSADYLETAIKSKILSITGYENSEARKLLKKQDGGYMIITSGEGTGGFNDIIVSVADEEMNIISTTAIGGSLNEAVFDATMDDYDNLYIVGNTNSTELRMDAAIEFRNTSDAYIAKVDFNGVLQWQKGFSDISKGFKGTFEDCFNSIEFIDNKLYCIGYTENLKARTSISDLDLWLAVFDTDGQFIRQRNLPSWHAFPQQVGGVNGIIESGGIKLSNGDLLIRMCNVDFMTARNFTRTCVLMRYRPSTDAIIWQKYFNNNTPEGDLSDLSEMADGNILGFTFLFQTMIKINGETGDVISSNPTPLDFDSGYSYITAVNSFSTKIGEFTYHFGSVYTNLSFAFTGYNQIYLSVLEGKPWMMKVDGSGEVIFSKIYDIPDAAYYSGVIEDNDNLLLFGDMYKYRTKSIVTFTQMVDKNGNLIN